MYFAWVCLPLLHLSPTGNDHVIYFLVSSETCAASVWSSNEVVPGISLLKQALSLNKGMHPKILYDVLGKTHTDRGSIEWCMEQVVGRLNFLYTFRWQNWPICQRHSFTDSNCVDKHSSANPYHSKQKFETYANCSKVWCTKLSKVTEHVHLWGISLPQQQSNPSTIVPRWPIPRFTKKTKHSS